LKHEKPDHEATEFADHHKEIKYPKPDGKISFDLLTSLYRYLNHSSVYHTISTLNAIRSLLI
jgi:flavin-dependent dehydrogenase